MNRYLLRFGVTFFLALLAWGCGYEPPESVDGTDKKNYDRSINVPTAQTCPSSHPVNCESWCCPSGSQCDPTGPQGQKCSTSAPTVNPDGGVNPSLCPKDIPIDCGTFCCPEGTVCAPDSPEGQQCRMVIIPPAQSCLSDLDCTSQQICVLNDKNNSECADLCQRDADCNGQCCWATDDPNVGACGPCD